MADRLTGIEVFVRAIRAGGLSAAAREMRMSPAMAGKHLDALEHRLGITLVRRTTRRLSLTEAGQGFLEGAERLLGELAEVEAEASAGTAEVQGLLRVAVPVSYGTLHIAPLVPGFTRLHPKVTIELGLNDRHVDLMDEGWDLAIRIGRLPDSSLVARKLAPAPAIICAAPGYLAERGIPATIAELGAHDCLGYTLANSVGTQSWSFGKDGAIKVPVHGSLHANNGEALLAAAIAGQGLIYGPTFIAAQALAKGQLVPVLLDVPLIDFGAVYAVTRPDRRPSLKTRAWVDYLGSALASL